MALAQSPLEQAVQLARARNYREARRTLQDVREPADSNQRVAFHRLKAAVASGLGEFAEAAAEMRQALLSATPEPALLVATALAELQAGETDAARQAYQRAIELDPGNEQYRVALAFGLIRAQSFGPAIEDLQLAIAVFPQSTRLRTLLGIAQYAAGEVNAAVSSLSKAIYLDRSAEPAYRCLARILLQSAAAPAPSVIEQLCGWNLVVCDAMKLRRARETQDASLEAEAIAGLQKAARDLKNAPEQNTIAHCELARAREWAGRLTEARTELEACVAADPSAQNHYRLGLVYKRLGFSELAQKEMLVRKEILQGMSEETASGIDALRFLP